MRKLAKLWNTDSTGRLMKLSTRASNDSPPSTAEGSAARSTAVESAAPSLKIGSTIGLGNVYTY